MSFDVPLVRLRDARIALDAAQDAFDSARKDVEAALEVAGLDRFEVEGVGRVTWTLGKNTSKTDWQTVAKESGATPELIAAFTEEKPGVRAFRFTPA